MRGFFATAVAMAASLHCLAAGAEPFPIDRCPAPSAYSGKAADVDRECGPSGQAPEVEHQAQNQAKNNLCAANPGKAIPLTKRDFTRCLCRVSTRHLGLLSKLGRTFAV